MENASNVSLIKKEKIKTVLESLSKGTSFVKACKAADINQATFWRWRRQSKKLNQQVLQVLDSRTQTVEDALYKAAVEGNVTAQIFWLKNRAPDRWRDRYEQNVAGDIKVKFQIVE